MKHQTPFALVALAPVLLSGCDGFSYSAGQAFGKGTIDAVLECMEHNAKKTEFFSEGYIRQQCTKKHELRSTGDPDRDPCSAVVNTSKSRIRVSFDVSNDYCRNTTDNIVTSLTTEVRVKNIPRETDEGVVLRDRSFFGTRENLWILPDRIFEFSTTASIPEDYQDAMGEDIGYCSDLEDGKEEICVQWGMDSYTYVRSNID